MFFDDEVKAYGTHFFLGVFPKTASSIEDEYATKVWFDFLRAVRALAVEICLC